MGIAVHSEQSLVLVLGGQDHSVFTHLLDGVREADDGYLTTDAEPAGRSPVILARLTRSRAGSQHPRQAPSVPSDIHFRGLPAKVCPRPRAELWMNWVA